MIVAHSTTGRCRYLPSNCVLVRKVIKCEVKSKGKQRLRAYGNIKSVRFDTNGRSVMVIGFSINFMTIQSNFVRFELFTAVTMKNGIFWDVKPCGSCKNQRFGPLSSQRASVASYS
jgi:hypothetical protein